MFSAAALRPMLASLPPSPPPLKGEGLLYEPKYDGIRAITLVEPAEAKTRVRFWSRLGNEKTAQFPELVAALGDWGAAFKVPAVLDGEIVALDAAGKPAGFQRLQNRIHVSVPGYRSSKPIVDAEEQPAAFIAFDLLRHGDEDSAHYRWSSGVPVSRRCSQSTSRHTRRSVCRNRSPEMASRSTSAPSRKAGKACW